MVGLFAFQPHYLGGRVQYGDFQAGHCLNHTAEQSRSLRRIKYLTQARQSNACEPKAGFAR